MQKIFANGGSNNQKAAKLKLARLLRVARESAKLNRKAEKRLADVGLESDHGQWPKY